MMDRFIKSILASEICLLRITVSDNAWLASPLLGLTHALFSLIKCARNLSTIAHGFIFAFTVKLNSLIVFLCYVRPVLHDNRIVTYLPNMKSQLPQRPQGATEPPTCPLCGSGVRVRCVGPAYTPDV